MRTLFATDEGNPRNGFEAWRDAVVETFWPVEISKIGDGPFRGSVKSASAGRLAITRVFADAISLRRGPDAIRRSNNPNHISVMIQTAGRLTSRQNDSVSVQQAGDILVLERLPGGHDTSDGNEQILFQVPRHRIEGLLGPAQNFSNLSMKAAQPSVSLVTTFVRELIRRHRQLDAATADRMSAIGVDLLVASIAEHLAQEVPKSLYGSVVVQRAKAYVEDNLGDPTLDPPHLAMAVGVSLRRLQELFHERGRHISDWIWQRRLEVAAARLIDPDFARTPIGTVAYGCGFSSQAHFSRRFKDRFGSPPSEYRIAASIRPGTPPVG